MNLLPLIVLLLCPVLIISKDDCLISRCGDDGPQIRFPFRLKGQQPLHCGYPGFELSCIKNITTVQLSSSGLFSVMDIDYMRETIFISDPDDCLPKRLLNYSLSNTPFRQGIYFQWVNRQGFQDYDDYYSWNYNELANYSLLNCSTPNNHLDGTHYGYIPVACLSIKGHTVFVVDPSMSMASSFSCDMIKKIPLPLPYQSDLSSYSISLQWTIPKCQDCEERGGHCRFKNSTSSETACFNLPPPDRDRDRSFDLDGSYVQNPYLPPPKGPSHSHKPVIIGVSVATFHLLLALVTALTLFSVKRTERKEEKGNRVKIEKFLMDHKSNVPKRYSYGDIKEMTNQFKKRLGEGGFGSVFKGKLPNEVPVAVKVLNNSKGNGEDFTNEVGTIGMIHHVNVVRLLGFCAEGSTRALIYEFMSNNSLAKYMSSANTVNPSLGWEKRYNITIGIAKGIEYLHQGCNQRILHLDIKPQNVLLDPNFNPKISDFGLAKLCSKDESLASMTAARGTIGYIAPEVFAGNFGNVSDKSDVYSFGMLVLEMVGARNLSNVISRTSQVYLPEWTYSRLIQGEDVDLKVDSEEDAKIAKKLMIVAFWCVQWYPVNRPSMKAVVRMLEGESDNLVMPPNPFASTANARPN